MYYLVKKALLRREEEKRQQNDVKCTKEALERAFYQEGGF